MPVLIDKTVLMDASGIRRALTRISHEILEKNKGMEDIVLVGIRTRGVPIAERIAKSIESIEGKRPPVGILDITLYRDDLSTLSYQPIVHPTELPVDITGKHVVLVANLKPAKLRGVVSEGMILAASDGKGLKVLEVNMPAGTEVR